MPHVPFRKIVNTLLYVWQWASKSATHRWLQRWQADGTLAAMQARILGIAEERGMIRWEYGAVDGAFSPWEGRGRGCRPRGERQRDSHPQPHGRGRHALSESHHAGQWG